MDLFHKKPRTKAEEELSSFIRSLEDNDGISYCVVSQNGWGRDEVFAMLNSPKFIQESDVTFIDFSHEYRDDAEFVGSGDNLVRKQLDIPSIVHALDCGDCFDPDCYLHMRLQVPVDYLIFTCKLNMPYDFNSKGLDIGFTAIKYVLKRNEDGGYSTIFEMRLVDALEFTYVTHSEEIVNETEV